MLEGFVIGKVLANEEWSHKEQYTQNDVNILSLFILVEDPPPLALSPTNVELELKVIGEEEPFI